MKKKIITTLFLALVLAGCHLGKTSFDLPVDHSKPTSTETVTSSETQTSSSKSSVSLDPTLVHEIQFENETVEIKIGAKGRAEYYIYPTTAANQDLTWTSSDYEVATVDQNGNYEGLKEGTATITAVSKDGTNVSNSFALKVSAIHISDLQVEPSSKTVEKGTSFKLHPLITPSNATYKQVSYHSSNTDVATVSDDGVVETFAAGQAVITVTSVYEPDLFASCLVRVTNVLPTSISLAKYSVEIGVGDSYQIVSTLLPENADDKTVSYKNNNTDVATVSATGEVTGLERGVAKIDVRSVANPELTTSITINVYEPMAGDKTALDYNFKDYTSNNVDGIDCADYEVCNALIVPVWFSNSNQYLDTDQKAEVREDIVMAYTGTNEETGWRSVKTFYEEESRGRFTLNATVTDWYSCGMSASSFASESQGGYKTMELVQSAVTWYKRQYSVNNMKAFDADQNGNIDSVMLIYAWPNQQNLSGWGDNGNFWAYCYWLENQPNLNDPTPNTYFWASYDFMYSDTRYCNVDAHTYIHEFGHVLGLDDYYDYSGQYNPAAGFSMQDNNVGGHDPYSCMALGWVDPFVVEESATIEIRDFQSSGDVIMLTNKFHNSPFDEYFLIELYTPTGLNEFDSQHQYERAYPQGPNDAGIRIWHVDARLLYTNSSRYKESDVTTNPLIENYNVTMMMSNTFYRSDVAGYCSPLGSAYGDYNELQLIRNNTSSTYKDKNNLSSGNLFKKGDTFSLTKFKKQFKKEYYLNNGEASPFTVKVTSLSSSRATIEITKQ